MSATLGFWDNFALGAGCVANPIQCYKVHTELDRIREKVDKGEPVTQAEQQWVETGQADLTEEAQRVAEEKIKEPAREAARSLSANFVWPIALAIGVALVIR